jgi:hypothetical protein
MAVDRALGDEEPGSDLLVAEALGDQVRDLCLPLAEQLRARRSGAAAAT